VLAALPISASADTKLVAPTPPRAAVRVCRLLRGLVARLLSAAGLDVEIKPAPPWGDDCPVREIPAASQFGTGRSVARSGNRGPNSLLLLAPRFQESGAAVYYRADRDRSLARLAAPAKLGDSASNSRDLELRTALYGEGNHLEKVKKKKKKKQICRGWAGGTIDDPSPAAGRQRWWLGLGAALAARSGGFC